MALPAINRPAPALPVLPARSSAASARVDGDGDSRTQAPAPRRPGASALATALSMADDVSTLVATLQRRRDAQNGAGTGAPEAWIDHVLDEKVHQKLAGFREQLGGLRSPAQALSMLKQLFPDPSDVLAVLRALLAEDELEALRGLLQEALDQLLAEQAAQGNAAALRGGANVGVKARLAARDGQLSARQLRHSYREFLGHPGDCVGEYSGWIEQYGFAQRARVVDFMEHALAADMYALDPSASLQEFGRLLRQVRNLAVLRSVDELLVQDIQRSGLLTQLATTAEALVLGLLDRVRGLQDWKGLFAGPLAGTRVALGPAQRARLLQVLRRALKNLPDAVWADPAARDAALDSLETVVVESMKRERGHGDHGAGVLA